jgi:MFS family permease
VTRAVVDAVVTSEVAESLMRPRTDLLVERRDDDGVFHQVSGPFRSYERRLRLDPQDDGHIRVTEQTEFRLDIPLWAPLFHPLMKRALVDTKRWSRRRWWWPAEVLPAVSARLLGALSVLAIIAGYLGVLIGQTITFAAEQFGANDAAQGRTLAAIRIGVIVSVIAIRRADRIGRRPLLLGFAVAALFFTVLGATSSNLAQLGFFQAISRGFTTGLLTLLTLAVTEEVPAGVRALGVSLMAMCSGLGAGMVLWVLPVADLGPGAWRWTYIAPMVFVPALIWVARRLPETRRFDRATETAAPAPVDRRRFTLIAFSAFASALFLSPASQLLNEYLRDEQNMSAGAISAFRLLTGTPAGLVVLVAGIAADRVGRKPIGGIGLGVGVVFSALVFFSSGAALWVIGTIGFWTLAGAFPALRGYQTELFPTRARARVGGWIDLITVTGSAIGLVTVGELSERWGALGPAISVLAVAPLIVVVLIVTVYPETASRELEVFNPDDPGPDRSAPVNQT